MRTTKYLSASVLGVLLVGLLQAQMGGLIGQYMAIFYTDTLGIPAQWVGTLLFVVIMWDALNDPIEGIITDNIPFGKHGKYRMAGLWANVFLALTSVLIFWVPSSFSLMQKIIYAYIINILWRVAYSFVPVLPLTANVSADPAIRTRINSIQRLLILGVGLLTSYTFPLVSYFGNGDSALGYRYMIIIFVLPLFIISFVGNLLIREKPLTVHNGQSDNHKFHYRDFGQLIRKNRPFRIFLLFSIVSSMISPFMFAGFIYYIKYSFGEFAMIPLFSIAMAGFALGVFLSSLLAKIIERKTLLSWSYLILTLTFIIFFFLGKQNLYLTYTLYGAINMFLGLTFINTSTLNMEIMDYHEVHFGVRPAAMISAVVQFIGKAQYAIAGYVVLQTLSFVGFQANEEMTSTVFRGLIWVTFMIPALFSLASAFVVRLYPISKQEMLNIHSQLQSTSPIIMPSK